MARYIGDVASSEKFDKFKKMRFSDLLGWMCMKLATKVIFFFYSECYKKTLEKRGKKID